MTVDELLAFQKKSEEDNISENERKLKERISTRWPIVQEAMRQSISLLKHDISKDPKKRLEFIIYFNNEDRRNGGYPANLSSTWIPLKKDDEDLLPMMKELSEELGFKKCEVKNELCNNRSGDGHYLGPRYALFSV